MKRILGLVALFALSAQAQVDLNNNRNDPQVQGIAQTSSGGTGSATGFGYTPRKTGTSLTLTLVAGKAYCSGSPSVATYAGGTLTMTASATNYVYLNPAASCVPAVKTTAFTATDIPIAVVTTSGSAITTIVDQRTAFTAIPNSSAGITLATQIIPPITGQYVVIYPTTSTVTNTLQVFGTVDATSGKMFRNGSCSLCFPYNGHIDWSGFGPNFTATGIPNANVTAIYATTVASLIGAGQVGVHQFSCTDGSHSAQPISTLTSPFPLQQFNAVMSGSPTTFNFSTASCDASDTSSLNFSDTSNTYLDTVALVVYYTGTAVPLSTSLNIAPCLSLNPAINTLGIDETCLTVIGGGVSGQAVGVVGLGGSATTITSQSHINENTPGTTEVTQKLSINTASDPSQATMTYKVGHAPTGTAGAAVIAPETSGNLDVNENNTGFSRVCTAANGVCAAGGSSVPPPPGFPQQLLGMSGTQTSNSAPQTPTIVPDGLSWDANGIGGPSAVIFVKGEYWECTTGYPSASLSSAVSFGCWHGNDLTQMVPYSGNPIYTPATSTWNAACNEGIDLGTDGTNVYVSWVGFTTTGAGCDGFGSGSIGIASTTVANWPASISAAPSVPTIPMPGALHWLYRSGPVIDINGICHSYANAGDASDHGVIVEFTTAGTCATTATVAANWSYVGIVLSHSQTWEGAVTNELQDPQVFQLPNGLWVMIYASSAQSGYAITSAPDTSPTTTWTKLSTNPIQAMGYLFWLPRVVEDGQGNFSIYSNANNTNGIYYSKGQGTTQYNQFYSNAGPVTSGNPAWVQAIDPTTAAMKLSTTYPTTQPAAHFWNDPALQYTFTKTGDFTAATSVTTATATATTSVTSPLVNATTTVSSTLPLKVTNPSLLAGNYVGFLVGTAFAAHSSFFPLWWNTTVPYADFETYSSGDPMNFGANQYTFPGGPVSVGNTSFTGASMLSLPGLFNVGTTNQFFVTSAGAATATNVTDSALTSGNCVQASTGGLLTTTSTACPIAPVSNAVTSATGGSGTGTITCATAACTNLRGSYTVAGGTFATGSLLTLVWPTTTTAYVCSGSVLNNATGASIGYHTIATATGIVFSSLTSATGLNIDIDYMCTP